jgi:hypothetical protein
VVEDRLDAFKAPLPPAFPVRATLPEILGLVTSGLVDEFTGCIGIVVGVDYPARFLGTVFGEQILPLKSELLQYGLVITPGAAL